MDKDKSQVVLNSDGSNSREGNLQGSGQFTNINVGYCSKCLMVLDDSEDVVRDSENNLFCDSECRKYFHFDRRQDMDDLLSNFK